jgi:hypothetical protein
MAVTISDHVMISDQSPHSARLVPGLDNQWEVSWLPDRRVTRNQAITAMTLAEASSLADPGRRDRLQPFIQGWAEELGQAAAQIDATWTWAVAAEPRPEPPEPEAGE